MDVRNQETVKNAYNLQKWQKVKKAMQSAMLERGRVQSQKKRKKAEKIGGPQKAVKKSHAGEEKGGEGQKVATQRDAMRQKKENEKAMRCDAWRETENETESQMVKLLSWFGSQNPVASNVENNRKYFSNVEGLLLRRVCIRCIQRISV